MRLLIILSLSVTVLLSGCTNDPFHKETLDKTLDVDKSISKTKADNYKTSSVVDIKYPPADLTPLVKVGQPAWYGVKASPTINRLPFSLALMTLFKGQNVSFGFDHDVNQKLLVSTTFSGRLRDWLDQLSLASGYAYSIDGDHVSWHRLTTKTFDISAVPGTQTHMLGSKDGNNNNSKTDSGAGANGTVVKVQDKEYTNNSAELSVWNDLTKTVKGLLSSHGSVFVSESSSSITVKDFPENVREIAKVIHEVNEKLRLQVAVDTQIIIFKSNNSRADGIDWDVVRKTTDSILHFSSGAAGVLSSIEGTPSSFTVGVPATSSSSYSGSKVLLQALQQQGSASLVTSPRSVTLNDQVAEIRINTDHAYLAQSTTTQNTDTTSTSLIPGVVTDGFTMYILPKIDAARNEVYIQASTTLASLESLETVTSGESSIQTPELQKTRVDSSSRLKSGETLIVSGYTQIKSSANGSSNFKIDELGQKASSQNKYEVLILITPRILR